MGQQATRVSIMRISFKRTLFILLLAALMVAPAFTPALAAANQIVWKQFFSDTPESQYEFLRGAAELATDRNGNVIVTGDGTPGQIQKYSGGGRELWMRTVQIQGRDAPISDMAVDRGGNTYVAGNHIEIDAAGISYIRKYGPRGGHHWTRQLSTAFIENVAVGPGGSVYVVGYYPREQDTFIKKYSSQGKFLWSRRAPFRNMEDVAVGPGGGVYIIAYDSSVFYDANGNPVLFANSFANSPTVLRKYSPRGGVYWTRRVQVRGVGAPPHYRLTVDREGGVIFTPTRHANLYSLIIKYSHKGRRLWARRWSRIAANQHVTNDIAVDKDRNIYVVGYIMGYSTEDKGFARKYSPDGTFLWMRYFINGQALGGATDPEGNLYVTGEKDAPGVSSFLAKFRASTGL